MEAGTTDDYRSTVYASSWKRTIHTKRARDFFGSPLSAFCPFFHPLSTPPPLSVLGFGLGSSVSRFPYLSCKRKRRDIFAREEQFHSSNFPIPLVRPPGRRGGGAGAKSWQHMNACICKWNRLFRGARRRPKKRERKRTEGEKGAGCHHHYSKPRLVA